MQDLKINQIINTDRGSYVVLQNQFEDCKTIFIDSFESVLLTFHFTGYGELAHIRTIYQILSSFIESSGYLVNGVEIVNYNEGIGYAKVSLNKNKSTIYFNCSIADGFIISNVNNTCISCPNDVWDELDDLDDDINSEFDQEF